MKNLISSLALVAAMMVSCSSDHDESDKARLSVNKFSSDEYPQKWTLVEMSGSIANVPPTTGEDMSWQEYYIFNADLTFVKVRERDGVKSEADGTYIAKTSSNETNIVLTFTSGADLVSSCTREGTETLYVRSESEIDGTWSYCDGPGLKYERI